MLLVCTRMSPVLYPYVTRMSLVYGFTMDSFIGSPIQMKWIHSKYEN